MKFRTGLLLGAAFTAGVAIVPASNMLERQFGLSIFPMAFAQDSSRTDTYRLLRCSAMCSSGFAPNTSIRSRTRIWSRTPSTAC